MNHKRNIALSVFNWILALVLFYFLNQELIRTFGLLLVLATLSTALVSSFLFRKVYKNKNYEISPIGLLLSILVLNFILLPGLSYNILGLVLDQWKLLTTLFVYNTLLSYVKYTSIIATNFFEGGIAGIIVSLVFAPSVIESSVQQILLAISFSAFYLIAFRPIVAKFSSSNQPFPR